MRPRLLEAAPGGARARGRCGSSWSAGGRWRSCSSPGKQRFALHGTAYDGPRDETIRVWGRDRLRVLARLLPLLDEAEVYSAGYRPAELLVDPHGRDAAVAGPLGLDGQRLDGRRGARPARARRPSRAMTCWATSRRRSRSGRR